LPLWLEEGLAVHLGWETALAYQQTRGLNLYREHPPVNDADWIPWPDLFEMAHYPPHPPGTAAFYRQSGRFVEEVAGRIQSEHLGPLIATMAKGERPLRDVLETDYAWSADQWEAALERAERAVRQPAERGN